jgi:hypothetical protein
VLWILVSSSTFAFNVICLFIFHQLF